jgi:hypothetical protein
MDSAKLLHLLFFAYPASLTYAYKVFVLMFCIQKTLYYSRHTQKSNMILYLTRTVLAYVLAYKGSPSPSTSSVLGPEHGNVYERRAILLVKRSCPQRAE